MTNEELGRCHQTRTQTDGLDLHDKYQLRFVAKDVTSSKPLVSNGVVMIDENLLRGLYFA